MTYLAALLVIVTGYILYQAQRMHRLSNVGAERARKTRAFQKEAGAVSMLVVGDSTGVGVGAKRSEESVAGHIALALGAMTENRARSGACTCDIAAQLRGAARETYDIILVQVGGNDVMRFRSLRKAEGSLEEALGIAKQKLANVFVMTSGRVGRAPFFPYLLLRPILTARSYALRARFASVCARMNAVYVDLIPASVIFNTDYARYYSEDGLHPSGEGYRIWAEELLRAITARSPNPIATPARSDTIAER